MIYKFTGGGLFALVILQYDEAISKFIPVTVLFYVFVCKDVCVCVCLYVFVSECG